MAPGDAGFEFTVVQDYRIRLCVWEADEEFGPNAQIMFSDNFAAGFPVEDSVAAAEFLIGAVCAAMMNFRRRFGFYGIEIPCNSCTLKRFTM